MPEISKPGRTCYFAQSVAYLDNVSLTSLNIQHKDSRKRLHNGSSVPFIVRVSRVNKGSQNKGMFGSCQFMHYILANNWLDSLASRSPKFWHKL